MRETTLKFRLSVDANWQRKSLAQSSSHSRAIIMFCWNKIRQRNAFSKRSICFYEDRASGRWICDRRNRVRSSFCVATILGTECPLWVRSGHQRTLRQCPLYPRKLTLGLGRAMSALCQKQTFCAAPKTGLFDHLVGGHKKARRHRKPERLCCLEVECRLIPGRCLHRKVEWFGAS